MLFRGIFRECKILEVVKRIGLEIMLENVEMGRKNKVKIYRGNSKKEEYRKVVRLYWLKRV